MDQEPSNTNHTDLIVVLTAAVNNLKAITESANQNIPHIFNIDIEEGRLVYHPANAADNTRHLARALLPKYHEECKKRGRRIKQELFNSIEAIKKHYRIIQKQKRGDKDRKRWAKDALDSINTYNAVLINFQHGHFSLKKKLLKLLYSSAGISLIDDEINTNLIDIPSEIFMRFDSVSESADDIKIDKIASSLKKGKNVEFSKTERDIFYMRAITLAEKSKLPPELGKDLNELMRKAPITAMETEGDSSSSVISMVQMLTPFPGEVITVQGQFKRNEKRAVSSVPDPGSFRVSTIVTQTGFPHPSQYTGWALSNSLIPDHPLRMDLLTRFQALQNIKKQIASDLLPGKRLNLKAKQLLRLKKLAFEEDGEAFVRLHHELSRRMIACAPYKGLEKKLVSKRLDNYYNRLENHPSPFDYLSQTHHLINKFFIEFPYEQLHQEWQEKQNQELHQGKPKERYQASSKILHDAMSHAFNEVTSQLSQPQTKIEEATLKFILLQGQVIGEAAISLYLQHFSEKIGYAPPLLKDFEQQIQTCSFRQIFAFQKELEMDLSNQEKATIAALQKNFQRLLEEDLAIFDKEGSYEESAAKISHELERYYNSRYAYQAHLSRGSQTT